MSTKNLIYCRGCNNEFYERYRSNDFYYKCTECTRIYNGIHNHTLDEIDIVPGYFLRVTYEVVKGSHDGYCSDPGDRTSEGHITMQDYRIPKILRSTDFDDDDNLVNHTFFQIRPTSHCYCGGRAITYNIISAKRMKKKYKYCCCLPNIFPTNN